MRKTTSSALLEDRLCNRTLPALKDLLVLLAGTVLEYGLELPGSEAGANSKLHLTEGWGSFAVETRGSTWAEQAGGCPSPLQLGLLRVVVEDLSAWAVPARGILSPKG